MTIGAHLALLHGDRQAAESQLRACVAAFTAIGDEWATAICLEAIAYLAEQRGDPVDAAESLRAAGDIARELGLWGFEARVLARLGTLAAADEHWDEADRLHREALQLSQELGFKAGVALTLNGIAFSRRSRGQLDARRRVRRRRARDLRDGRPGRRRRRGAGHTRLRGRATGRRQRCTRASSRRTRAGQARSRTAADGGRVGRARRRRSSRR